ncbi:MAG: PEP-CTERM sorting domain-containing protein [Candidatus Tectomicrobia bacterium]|uniref:PEP-CTERM sorting domain-containing protein n=1 Tax=Tectimicrobiota bacterium TaxID=2528274 RepID=A0A937W8R9_UNCTE|nr:PEP-CTERM sorting domain-containing protein [Candidatus Tectomicrobia bacterium]
MVLCLLGEPQRFSQSQVPEPSTWLLFGTGVLAGSMYLRRRGRQRQTL